MEDNKNRNYDQEDRDYKDAPATTDFEKSILNNDPNSGNTEEENLNRSIDDSSTISNPIDNPDDDFEGDSIIYDTERKPSLEDESDIDDEDLNYESDFNEPDIDIDGDEEDEEDNDEINNENSDLDDDWAHRKN